MSTKTSEVSAARKLGYLVGGGGMRPAEAAATSYLYNHELVQLRIDHWESYDEGLRGGSQ